MDTLRILGGARLCGIARPGAAKNAVLPMLAASIMMEGKVVIRDCPRLIDTENMRSILRALGAKCDRVGDDVHVDASGASCYEMPVALSRLLRSSIFMMGPLIARHGRALVTYPGGCEIGLRPIDLHIKSLRAMGVMITESHGMIRCDGKNLHGADLALDFPSVGATENIMMAAARASGTTRITNPAREPEIMDLQGFLNAAGADISGAGTGMIVIRGRDGLGGADYRPIPDRIEAGTLLCAAAVTGGEIELRDVEPPHMTSTLGKLSEMGCRIKARPGRIMLTAPKKLKPIALRTSPYPGFPTDMQAQMMALGCRAAGTSMVVEQLFENRFQHAAELRRMGADIAVHDRVAVVRGGRLTGAQVEARDLRGGAALVLAGLAAEGATEIRGAQLIDRGYQAIEHTLSELGAHIVRL